MGATAFGYPTDLSGKPRNGHFQQRVNSDLSPLLSPKRRRIAGRGYGPLSNNRKALSSILPIRDLIAWTLAALHDGPEPTP